MALYLGDVVDAPSLLTDQRSYHWLGARLVAGHGFSFAQAWYPFTPADTPTAFWSFLYALFVAGVYALFGVHPLAGRIVQAVLGGALLPWMVYRLARRLFSAKAEDRTSGGECISLVAATAAAGYGYYILYAATLMTETYYIVLLLWSLEVSLRLGARLSSGEPIPRREALALGLSLGLAVLMRQSLLPWVPALFLWLLWRARRVGRAREILARLGLAGALLLICILPFTYRNCRVYGQFLLLNSNTGYAMYSAQHPMHGDRFSEFAAAPLPPGLEGMNEAQMDRELLRQGLRFVVEEPGRYLRLCLSRVRAYLEFWPTADTTPLHNVGRTASFGLALPLMLYGLFLALRDPATRRRVVLIPVFVLFYSTLHILTWAMVRYRLPPDAALMPFAALGLEDLWYRGRSWRARRQGARA